MIILLADIEKNIVMLWLNPQMEEFSNNGKQLSQHILAVLKWAAYMEHYLGLDHYYEYECRNWSIWRQPRVSKDMVRISQSIQSSIERNIMITM